MTDTRAQDFADALQRLERDGEVERFVSGQFAADAELLRPETGQNRGAADATTFWRQYLAQFETVESTFDRVIEAEDLGVLEWSSTGRLTNGRAIDYRGVSILDFAGNQVTRFVTYYDTEAFGPAAS